MLAYAIGLLLGIGVVVDIIFIIKRGYLIDENWRGAIKYISRQQEPFFFWVLPTLSNPSREKFDKDGRRLPQTSEGL